MRTLVYVRKGKGKAYKWGEFKAKDYEDYKRKSHKILNELHPSFSVQFFTK